MDTVQNDGGLTRQEIADFWENHWCAHFREAFKEGREEGREEGWLQLLSQWMKRNHLSAEAVVDQFSFSPSEREKLILALKEKASEEPT